MNDREVFALELDAAAVRLKDRDYTWTKIGEARNRPTEPNGRAAAAAFMQQNR